MSPRLSRPVKPDKHRWTVSRKAFLLELVPASSTVSWRQGHGEDTQVLPQLWQKQRASGEGCAADLR
jgi:hypothetical protein